MMVELLEEFLELNYREQSWCFKGLSLGLCCDYRRWCFFLSGKYISPSSAYGTCFCLVLIWSGDRINQTQARNTGCYREKIAACLFPTILQMYTFCHENYQRKSQTCYVIVVLPTQLMIYCVSDCVLWLSPIYWYFYCLGFNKWGKMLASYFHSHSKYSASVSAIPK